MGCASGARGVPWTSHGDELMRGGLVGVVLNIREEQRNAQRENMRQSP